MSALTLGGAAEEILGKEVGNRGGKNTLFLRHHQLERLHARAKALFPKGPLKALPKYKHFAEKLNYARNAAKHIANRNDSSQEYDPFIRANLESESAKMILRAIHNQDLLGLPRSEMTHRFYGWHLSTIYSDE